MQDLPPTAGSSVYEAWAIGSDGKPLPNGSFTVGSDGIASFEVPGAPAEDGLVLALTHEPGPGAKTPTLPIIAKGVTTAAS
jgi:anti-sigma-K factor RskA